MHSRQDPVLPCYQQHSRKKAAKPDGTTFINTPLNTLVSARVRLTETQREELKAAYAKLRRGSAPASISPVVSGATVEVQTAMNTLHDWYQQLGLNEIALGDCLGTRDSLSLPLVLRIQRLLGVEVIKQADIENACISYCSYVFIKALED